MPALLAPSAEKFTLTYALFGFTIALALLSAAGVLGAWSGGVVAFLSLPANLFIQLIGPVRLTGMVGDVMLLVQFAMVLGLLLGYSYVLSSVALALRGAFLPRHSRRR